MNGNDYPYLRGTSHSQVTMQQVGSASHSTDDREYHSPIPNYPPIMGPKAMEIGEKHNLMKDFVDFSSTRFGTIVDFEGLMRVFSSSS